MQRMLDSFKKSIPFFAQEYICTVTPLNIITLSHMKSRNGFIKLETKVVI